MKYRKLMMVPILGMALAVGGCAGEEPVEEEGLVEEPLEEGVEEEETEL